MTITLTDPTELWDAYRLSHSTADRNKLIAHYLPYVYRQIGNGRPAIKESLLGPGTIGLIRAIEKFDIKRGVKFTTFARKHILGALTDSSCVPSGLPKDPVVFRSVTTEEEEPFGIVAAKEQKEHLHAEIKKLPPREALIMSLYYEQDESLRQIGERLNISESMVSRLHQGALVKLAKGMKELGHGQAD